MILENSSDYRHFDNDKVSIANTISRVTVDLAYLFGSSSFAKFRDEHLDGLLKIYYEKLIQDLETFGYPKSVYPFDKFLSDYEDTWVFGFVMGCMHIQVSIKLV
jgi:hypothetical protein